MATAIAIAGVLFLVWAAAYARRPAEAERGLTPVHCEQAGARFDAFKWSIPFVRVATFADFVSISCVTHHVVLSRGDVTAIDEERAGFSVGLRLHHHRADLPRLLLWSRDRPGLEAALRASLAV